MSIPLFLGSILWISIGFYKSTYMVDRVDRLNPGPWSPKFMAWLLVGSLINVVLGPIPFPYWWWLR